MDVEDSPAGRPAARQRVFGRASPKCALAFHAFAFAGNAAVLVWQWVQGTKPAFHFAGVYVFLTIWGLTLQTLYFLVALLTSVSLVRDTEGVSSDWTDRETLGTARGGPRLLGGQEGIASMPFGVPDDAVGVGVFEDDPSGAGGTAATGEVTPFSDLLGRGPRCCACRSGIPPETGLGRAERALAPWTVVMLSLRDRLYSLELPIALFVSAGFWGAIFPAAATRRHFVADPVDGARSCWEHGATLLLILAETVMVRHRYPRGRLAGTAVTGAFALCYCLWNVLTREENGVWPYPNVQLPLERLGMGVELPVYAALVGMMAGGWLLGRWLSVGPVWGGGACSDDACCCCCCGPSCCGGRRHRGSSGGGWRKPSAGSADPLSGAGAGGWVPDVAAYGRL